MKQNILRRHLQRPGRENHQFHFKPSLFLICFSSSYMSIDIRGQISTTLLLGTQQIFQWDDTLNSYKRPLYFTMDPTFLFSRLTFQKQFNFGFPRINKSLLLLLFKYHSHSIISALRAYNYMVIATQRIVPYLLSKDSDKLWYILRLLLF